MTEAPYGPPGSTSGMDGTVAGLHVYADNGTYTVTVTVTDDDDESDVVTFVVHVDNVSPSLAAGPDHSINEGDTVALGPATFHDQGTADTHTSTIDWGDGTVVEPGALTESPFGPPGSPSGLDGTIGGSHTYADNGVYTVIVTVVDDDGGGTSDTFKVTVGNVIPALDAGVNVEYVIFDDVALAPSPFSDPGFNCADCSTIEDFTASIDWGDGSSEAMTVSDTPGSPGVQTLGSASAGAHVYPLPGYYTVTVTVVDDDGGTKSDTLTVHVMGPQDLKARANELLAPYDSDHQISTAIGNIDASLEPDLWLDAVHIDDKHGDRVFSEEKQAVTNLEVALAQKGNKALSPGAVSAAQQAIELLVNADRVIALTALVDAESLSPSSPVAQKVVADQVARALSELIEGNAQRGDSDWKKAIDSYMASWNSSGVAIDQSSLHDKH